MGTDMPIRDGRTVVMQDAVERCEDIDDLQLVLEKNSQYFIDWKAYINYLVNTGGYSYSQFAKKCGMSHTTIAAWCEKGTLPRSRNQFIQLGFGLAMSLETMNQFLQRYGKYPKLYPKNIEDAIFIFALNQDMTFDTALSLQGQFHHIIKDLSHIKTGKQPSASCYETLRLQSKLLSLHDIQQLEDFVTDNIGAFLSSYERLISYIDTYIEINTLDFTGTTPQESLNSFFHTRIQNPKVINHFNKMISKLKNFRIIPKRNDLIVLGVYLDMSLDDANQMLSMAGMEPLCAKDKLESIIIYAIENAILNNPDIEFSNALLLKNLSENPELKENCRKIIERYEMTPYRSAEEDGGIIKYVQETLRQVDRHNISEFSSLFAS